MIPNNVCLHVKDRLYIVSHAHLRISNAVLYCPLDRASPTGYVTQKRLNFELLANGISTDDWEDVTSKMQGQQF